MQSCEEYPSSNRDTQVNGNQSVVSNSLAAFTGTD
jgi:hypothetical protein